MRHPHLRDRAKASTTTTARDATVRPASPDDLEEVAQLAALDSVRLPSGPMLVAEVDDDLRAALSLSEGSVVADPFYPTAHLVELLRKRAIELSG